MSVLTRLESLIGRISGFSGWLAGWLCVAMIATVFLDVILRYAFRGGSIAMQELEWHFFAAMFLLGAAYTMREDANVRVDIWYSRMEPKARAAVNLCGTLVFVFPMAAVIIYSSWDFVAYAYAIKEGSPDPGGLPYRFVIKAVLPLAWFLVMLQAAAVAVRSLSQLLEREPAPPAGGDGERL